MKTWRGVHFALMACLASGVGCRGPTGPRRDSPVTPGVLSPKQVDPKFAADWDAVRRAQEQDPGSDGVREAADKLLARQPPMNLRVAAVQAKAGYAYANGNDPEVVRFADEMLRAVEEAGGLEPSEQHLIVGLQRLRALALARSGDPGRALQQLNELALEQAIPEVELVIAQATAFDRAGKTPEAVLAYVRWRAQAPDGSADAAFARHRLSSLAPTLSPSQLEKLARQVSGTPAAECLLGFAGQPVAESGTSWVKLECVPAGSGQHIGILLPRTGRFAGLSDTHYAAALAAVRVLESGQGGMSVIWADSGSTPEEAQKAASGLLQQGVTTLIGPVGSKNVRAVAELAKGQAAVLVPGEGRGAAKGVAPSLEARGAVLVAYAKSRGTTKLAVLGPPSGYTRRVVGAMQREASKLGIQINFVEYPASETSFRKTLAPLLPGLRKGTGLVVVDRIKRAELVLRQLARDGLSPAKTLVLATGEGVGEENLKDAKGLFDGVAIAPVAWPDGETGFADFYRQQEGTGPDDQAWLVWRALSQAWRGEPGNSTPAAGIVIVEGGRLVLDPFNQQATLQPPE